ncbi:sodium-dependent transporter [Pseudoalteromonas sp. NBT06-2]|uniref:sodium-dependent transporter n=1 Tax=Pseudoalteromonas sp. NBT06-2 TaxID=2025950 RepID=UPI000BA69AA2|nr:sodium-dependent transporter [Pseudoalteromonas sp. NBT06-2]PAJ75582.1 sodium-dependent transporter [Pseudoalteromonas sp. NBT06-2]
MSTNRGEFTSRFGFIMAAAGSAVGLGNIWGFPTQTASNGGAAFVLAYLILAFCLAYPAFMAELVIGRYGRANAVTSLRKMSNKKWQHQFSFVIGFGGILCAALILSFYGIIAGWMMSYTIEPITTMTGFTDASTWLTSQSTIPSLIFTTIFMSLTVYIIRSGVQNGIEKWSKRLMPMLILLLICLIIYLMTLEGASEGLNAYLNPDFTKIFEPQLLISALGQAFFSLSLGTSVMIIYGSYISKKENLVTLGAQVTLIDVSIAFLAGLLVIPAMYVAQAQGLQIFAENGSLISGPDLVFTVLPSLFDGMGFMGSFVALAFFALMSIAALTSSISMLEAPVSYVVERFNLPRNKATLITSLIILTISIVIIFNMQTLFSFVVTLATEYGQPIIGMFCCIFIGWIWHRSKIIKELKNGYEDLEQSLFWKIWPWYVKFICPLCISLVFLNAVL